MDEGTGEGQQWRGKRTRTRASGEGEGEGVERERTTIDSREKAVQREMFERWDPMKDER